ncbi:MAG: GNAT family N-acetyltransferase [Rhodospirillales bacterium]|nr:GNAT family N-acetyltransferase [Rhodospirillales bacterium]
MTDAVEIRAARPEDAGELLRFVRLLAVYEKLEHTVVADAATIARHMFGPRPAAEAALAEIDGRNVGFALFFSTFSTFACAPGLYLEDLYVEEEMRGRGIGKALISWGARLAVERGCARYQWSVLDWNVPARDFYKSLGATETPEWIGVRLEGEALARLAAKG